MGKLLGWMLMAGMLCGGVAHADGRHAQWKAVKRLAPGKRVQVWSQGQGGIEDCRVVHVDDASLTCEREKDTDADWDAGSGARLVFPRSAVEGVSVWEDGSDRRVLIGMGVGFSIGALLCSEGGPGPAFICAGIGALIGACFAASGPPGGTRWYPPGTPRPVREPEMVWKMVYRAQAAASVSP